MRGALDRAKEPHQKQGVRMKTSSYENFPYWMVVVCSGTGLLIYAIGLYLMLRLSVAWGALYAAYCAWMEWRLLSGSCRYCHYFGKRCGFGRGRICSWFLTKLDQQPTRKKPITWWSVVPDFMVSLVPVAAGIALLFKSFSWPVLLVVVVLAGLGSAGTALIRGQLACRYCRQREIGCPAEQLFNKTKHA
jgi:hypothetical protein